MTDLSRKSGGISCVWDSEGTEACHQVYPLILLFLIFIFFILSPTLSNHSSKHILLQVSEFTWLSRVEWLFYSIFLLETMTSRFLSYKSRIQESYAFSLSIWVLKYFFIKDSFISLKCLHFSFLKIFSCNTFNVTIHCGHPDITGTHMYHSYFRNDWLHITVIAAFSPLLYFCITVSLLILTYTRIPGVILPPPDIMILFCYYLLCYFY